MIQPLSYIHSDAKVADNVIVEPFSTIKKMLKLVRERGLDQMLPLCQELE